MNKHLLQVDLDVKTYTHMLNQIRALPPDFIDQLPSYTIARCPYCGQENIERLDTYSICKWRTKLGNSVFHGNGISHHCQHFTLTQPFFHFHNIWPEGARGQLAPEKPHVIGHILETGACKAVIHALPICHIEDDKFLPLYTLFMVTYFAPHPLWANRRILDFSTNYVEPLVVWYFVDPPEGCEHWWDLDLYVEDGSLYWVDADDPELNIYTKDLSKFPYGNIEGRTWPYLHSFPYPYPKKKKKKR